MTKALVQIATAILYQDGQCLMQLRDDTPGIIHPKCWGFFGGHLEAGEDAETGLRRELMEEIGYAPPHVSLFRQSEDEHLRRFVFTAPLTVPVETLELNEGWDLALFSPEDIHRGDRFSSKIQQVRPIVERHRHTLLEFLAVMP